MARGLLPRPLPATEDARTRQTRRIIYTEMLFRRWNYGRATTARESFRQGLRRDAAIDLRPAWYALTRKNLIRGQETRNDGEALFLRYETSMHS